MEAVWLPVFRPSDDLKDALAGMTQARRSAAIVEDGDQYGVVFIGDVLEALDEGATRVLQVAGREAAHVAEPADARTHQVDLIRPLRTPGQYEQMLELLGCSYTVVAVAHGDALLVTQHEGQKDEATQANTWYCDGPRQHYFPKPLVHVGEVCPKCVGDPKGTIFLR